MRGEYPPESTNISGDCGAEPNPRAGVFARAPARVAAGVANAHRGCRVSAPPEIRISEATAASCRTVQGGCVREHHPPESPYHRAVRENLRVARFYFVLLALFTVGRWAQSLGQVDYAKGHHVFSIVILTFLSSAFFAAFCRRWRGYGLFQAVLLGMTLGLSAQLVIFLSTALSYTLDMQTYFNHPTALNSPDPLPMGAALTRRAGGLVAGPIGNGVAAFLGWLMGGVLPEPASSPSA
jgi:hypothetical protein